MSLHEQYPAYGGRGPSDLRLGISLGAIATIFIALRVYVRLRVNKFGTTALIWAIAAWSLTTITQCVGIVSILHGLGNHLAIIEEVGEARNFLLYTWITVFFFNLAIPTGKVAVAAFLIEMIGPTHPKIRRSLIYLSVLNIVANIPQVLLVWFQCNPVDALWDPLRQNQCDHRKSVYYTYFVGAIAALTDFYLAIIPIHTLIPLRIDRKLKWGLCFLMSCGVFAGVAAIVRTWAAKFILSPDSSYGVGILFRWGEVEEWVVLICMSVPPVWPLFRPYMQRFIQASVSRSQPRVYNYNKQDSSTAVASPMSPTFPPPLVTTTISVSSAKKAREATTPWETPSGSSSTVAGYEDDQPMPCIASEDEHVDVEGGWVELSRLKEPQQQQ